MPKIIYKHMLTNLRAKLKSKLGDCRGCLKVPGRCCSALVEANLEERGLNSGLCGMASDAVDAVRSAIPKYFKF